MNRKVRYLSVMSVLFILIIGERPALANDLLPGDILTAQEIRTLVSGRTVEVTFTREKVKGIFYFNANGEFEQLVDNWLEKGHWRVNKKARLCTSVEKEKWNCRMLVRNRDDISQYLVKKAESSRPELTYEGFHEGDDRLEQAKASSPPLERLHKEEIFRLFADKTVESITVRKGRHSLTYYYPNGTLELTRNGRYYNGTWRVTDNDRMCLSLEGSKEKCRIIVRQGSSYSKYIVKLNGKHQKSIRYRIFLAGKRLRPER